MRSWKRRLVFPILILAVAGFFTWQGFRDRAVQRPKVEAFATQVLTGGPYGATDAFIEDAIRRHLVPGTPYTFSIHEGDGGPAPDGAASHIILVERSGTGGVETVVGLRCRYDPDPARMAIVGLFEPTSVQP